MNYINGSELAGKEFIRLENGDLREVKGKFIPAIGDRYYCLDAFGAVSVKMNDGSDLDKWAIKHNRVFRTYEEYEDYRQFLEMLDEYTFDPNWNDENQKKWLIRFDHDVNIVCFDHCYFAQRQDNYFESKEKVKEFVEVVGKDRVKRYMFDVWE